MIRLPLQSATQDTGRVRIGGGIRLPAIRG